jgi:hypothetical protein
MPDLQYRTPAPNPFPGIIAPFRNIGGKFDVGWPHFGQVLCYMRVAFTNDAENILRA